MKVWIKVLLGIMAGFGGGFAAGFLTHKKLNDIQFEEVTQEEMDQLLEIPEDVRKLAEAKMKKILSEGTAKEKELPTDPDKLRNTLQGKTTYIQMDSDQKKKYSEIWNTVKDYSNEENANELPFEDEMDEDFLNELENDIEEEEDTELKNEKPHVITLHEFYEEHREYDKITIDWYEEDDIVLDEREEIVPDPKSYVGMSMKELFNDMPNPDGDPDAMFVRNDKYGTDYEVVRHHSAYNQIVGGVE